jgi:integrase/recombinase XerC
MTQLLLQRDPMRDWSNLKPEERKYRAATAIQQRDHQTLWNMAKAHLLFRGRKGNHLSHHTLKMYRIAVMELLEHWQSVNLLHPSADDAQEYVRWLEEGVRDTNNEYLITPKSPATVNQRISAARNLYNAFIWCGFEIENPFQKVKIRKDPTAAHEKRQEYSLETVRELLHQADEEGDVISKITIMLGVFDGLRVSEIINLRWSDIDFHERLIWIRGKGGKQRYVPLSATLSRELSKLERKSEFILCRKYNGYGPYTDESIRRRIDKLCTITFGKNPQTGKGYSYKAIHSFRHTFGVNMHDLVGLLETQAMMGHEDVSTTARYSKITSKKASQRARGAQVQLEHLAGVEAKRTS